MTLATTLLLAQLTAVYPLYPAETPQIYTSEMEPQVSVVLNDAITRFYEADNMVQKYIDFETCGEGMIVPAQLLIPDQNLAIYWISSRLAEAYQMAAAGEPAAQVHKAFCDAAGER